MDSNNLFDFVKQGFRVTVGAAAFLVETVGDPQKRETAFSEFQTQFSQRTEEWAQKGESTEQEARKTIDNLFSRQGWQKPKAETPNSNDTHETSTTVTNPDVQAELRELTEQIVALRTELEELRQSDSN